MSPTGTCWECIYVSQDIFLMIIIQIQYERSEGPCRCKEEVLGAWLKTTPGASWKELVGALRQMDEEVLATRLENE